MIKALWIDTYRENEKYMSVDFSILINVSQIVYLKYTYPLYLIQMTSGSFYISVEDAQKVKEAMIN